MPNISTQQLAFRSLADQVGEKYSPLCLQDKSQFCHLFLTKLLDVTDDPGVGQDYPARFALCLHRFTPKAPDGVCTVVYCIYSVSGAQGCLSPYEHQSSLSN